VLMSVCCVCMCGMRCMLCVWLCVFVSVTPRPLHRGYPDPLWLLEHGKKRNLCL
jgi:hypothetical protein